MTRARIGWIAGGALGAALAWWVISHTYWGETTVWLPPKGEALTNPSYAAQRFTEALGARSVRDRVFTPPSTDAVVVLTAFNWTLSDPRRAAIERWVESGGRLVVDDSLVGGAKAFERWSGITRRFRTPSTDAPLDSDECRDFTGRHAGSSTAEDAPYMLCGVGVLSSLVTNRRPVWVLEGKSGIQAVRVSVGRGTVTVVNGSPFQYMSIFTGDHARLFAAVTEVRRGAEVRFLTEADHPSLLALVWQHGKPSVLFALAAMGLLFWRGSVRFGPLEAPTPPARRSLAEQVRGSGRFALRHAGDDALHAACVRALAEAAHRRVPGYARLTAADRMSAVADLTGLDRGALASAVYHPRARRPGQLGGTIALVEEARRRLLTLHARSSHGTA